MSTVTGTSPAAPATDASRGRLARVLRLRHEAWTYAASLLTTLAAMVWALHLWAADLRVPFGYVGDAVAVAAHVKTVLETGWYESQPLLGWPAGQAYHDFPTADNLNFAIVRVLGLVSHQWPTVLNLYYLLGFPLTALAATWFLRRVGVSRPLTVALATLYAIAPYHFLRGESHLWLASYFTVPLALVVVLGALRGEPLWTAWSDRRSWRAWSRTAVTVVALALVTSGSSYYGAFTAVLLAAAGLGAWLRTRDWRRLGGIVVGGVVIVVTLVVNMAPDILYTRAHGASAAGFVRNRAEVEVYALKLSQLLLPVPGHRIGPLATLRAKYDMGYPLMSEQPVLGFVAGAGLVAAFVVIAWMLAVHGRRRPELTTEQAARTTTVAHLSLLVLVAFLFSTIGGLATFISFLTASLRGWNRMSIFIAALCLGIVGLALDAWLARVRTRRGVHDPLRASALGAGVALAVLAVGAFDQVTPGAAPDYPALRAAYEADATWVATVETHVPAGGAVFQVPYAGFPETPPVNGVFDSDQLKGFLHSATLHWSGAGIKGRPTTDWPRDVAELPPAQLADEAAIAGFDAVQVDRAALGLGRAGVLEAALAQRTGPAVATSADGRYALYDLTATAATLAAANAAPTLETWHDAVTDPVELYPGADASAADEGTGAITVKPGGSLLLENPRDAAVPVELTATVSAPGAASVTFLVDGKPLVTWLDGEGLVDLTFDAPAGRTTVPVQADVAGVSVTIDGVRVRQTDLPALAGAAS